MRELVIVGVSTNVCASLVKIINFFLSSLCLQQIFQKMSPNSRIRAVLSLISRARKTEYFFRSTLGPSLDIIETTEWKNSSRGKREASTQRELYKHSLELEISTWFRFWWRLSRLSIVTPQIREVMYLLRCHFWIALESNVTREWILIAILVSKWFHDLIRLTLRLSGVETQCSTHDSILNLA